ncbi:hypothetical protein CPB83DRAFT_553699 [Crepidotus variabilis]|uniref:Nephrocystin 3-like N-terminal domain-containing protein n=1 Tax=Crepidotus variabilis TaxID=179855 RepID=A0A9P6EA54_9AGAR|nr:hypothetical protein CPB83DRAFT_553699 [Crepidotus variabilis]
MLNPSNTMAPPSMANNTIQLFTGAHNVCIEGSPVFNISNNAEADFFTRLYQVITQNALHNANRKESVVRCLPGTGRGLSRGWKEVSTTPVEHNSCGQGVPAGFGKTAIAQSISEQLVRDDRLGGDFFFSLLGGRTDPRKLFLTLAYRLAKSNPTLKSAIESAIKRDPEIVNASLEDQFQHLIVSPLKSLKVNDGTLPLVILIDGLDECHNEDNQTKLLNLVTSIPQSQALPLCFLIVSRPEPWIAHAFKSTHSVTTIHLEEDEAADEGIRLYYNTEFAKLRAGPKYCHLDSNQWLRYPQLLIHIAASSFISTHPCTTVATVVSWSDIVTVSLLLGLCAAGLEMHQRQTWSFSKSLAEYNTIVHLRYLVALV